MTFRVSTPAPMLAAALFSLSPTLFAGSNLDPTWSSPGGYTVTTPGVANASPNAIAMDSIGRIAVAGYAHTAPSSASRFAVVRYTGFEDPGFGSAGVASINIGASAATANAVAIGPNDSIIVAGDCMDTSGAQYRAMCLVRFTSSGGHDLGFGELGRTIAQIGIGDAYAKAMVIDSSGRLLVAGYSSIAPSGNPAFTVARFNAGGTLDGSFGSGGVRTLSDPAGGVAFGYAIALDSDGKILIAGTVFNIAQQDGAFAVARLLPTGNVDTTFNGGNIASLAIGNGGGANGLAIDALHRPVLVGVANPVGAGSSTMALARFTATGLPDTSFGSGGSSKPPLPGCTEAVATAIRIDNGNRYYVGGTCRTTQPILALAHYNTNGSLDSAYAGKGYTAELFGSQAGITALLLDARNRPVVAGYDLRSNGFSAFVVNRHDVLFSQGLE